MSKVEFKAADILQAMDDATEPSYIFPMLDNAHFYCGAVRLTAFRGTEGWLITFSEVLYARQDCMFITGVCAVGNKMPSEGFITNVEIMKPSRRSPWTLPQGEFGVDPRNFSILVRGKERAFRPTAQGYKAAGIGVRSKMSREAQVLRYLVFKIGDELHASTDEQLKAVGRSRGKLRVLLQTDEYHHPRLMDELPSDTPSFRSLAQALASDDTSLFKPGKSNTHWKNWTELESIFG